MALILFCAAAIKQMKVLHGQVKVTLWTCESHLDCLVAAAIP
jgi:hypothetical protein